MPRERQAGTGAGGAGAEVAAQVQAGLADVPEVLAAVPAQFDEVVAAQVGQVRDGGGGYLDVGAGLPSYLDDDRTHWRGVAPIPKKPRGTQSLVVDKVTDLDLEPVRGAQGLPQQRAGRPRVPAWIGAVSSYAVVLAVYLVVDSHPRRIKVWVTEIFD
ncbi:hypothetical protein [Nonomuraea sp. NPDC050691]|uniref:hypothetical protein n=1 Tax=Nonomuraea sp. NPDC050691 TaxID=3155661 RepID=UPI0033F12804